MKKGKPILALACLSLLMLTACQKAGSKPSERRKDAIREGKTGETRGGPSAYEPPVELAELEDRAIKESSGVVASRRNTDVFWTHNDSGDDPIIYAFDRAGTGLGRWRVNNAEARDWEDIAAGPGPENGKSYLYIADTGDNDGDRDYVVVYRVAEPEVRTSGADGNAKAQFTTDPADRIAIRYPDGRHDSEALMVHPKTGDIYLVTKSLENTSGVYVLRAPYSVTSINTLIRIHDIAIRSILGGTITGGDISPDGRRVVLCDYLGAGELVLPEGEGKFDEIWKQLVATVDVGPRKHGEAICYRADGLAIIATSERRPTPLIEVKRKGS